MPQYSIREYDSLQMFPQLGRLLLVAFLTLALLVSASDAAKTAQKKKQDLNDNRGNTPFYLQDPYDEMCLGPQGFTACNEQALWILTRRQARCISM
jgi:hypothetical protein